MFWECSEMGRKRMSENVQTYSKKVDIRKKIDYEK